MEIYVMKSYNALNIFLVILLIGEIFILAVVHAYKPER